MAEQATGLWIPQSTSPKRIYGRHSAYASAQLSEWPKPLIQGTSLRVSQLSGHHNQAPYIEVPKGHQVSSTRLQAWGMEHAIDAPIRLEFDPRSWSWWSVYAFSYKVKALKPVLTNNPWYQIFDWVRKSKTWMRSSIKWQGSSTSMS